MEFKENLYHIRKEKGLSQEELALLCDVSRQAISKWENGTANPDMENLKTLSRSLNVSVDELLGNEKKQEEPSEKEVIYVERRYRTHMRYQSKVKLFGIPLVDVNLGKMRTEDGHWRVAKGIIAIGNISIGVCSIGLLSAGLFTIGVLTIGLLAAIGALSISYLAFGALAIGYISIGAVAIGFYSFGALSIGFHIATGAISYGPYALGVNGFGDEIYHLRSYNSCILDGTEYSRFQSMLNQESLPKIVELLLRSIPRC